MGDRGECLRLHLAGIFIGAMSLGNFMKESKAYVEHLFGVGIG
jgi:hypothetical protein